MLLLGSLLQGLMALTEVSARAGVSSEGPMGTGLLPSFLTWLPSSLPRTYHWLYQTSRGESPEVTSTSQVPLMRSQPQVPATCKGRGLHMGVHQGPLGLPDPHPQ